MSDDPNNNRGRSTPYNTRSRASLSSQEKLCAHCNTHHPIGDCPAAIEDPSPIRRIVQVQQQVEQVIQQELDTFQVFNDASLPPVEQESQGILPHSYEAALQTVTCAQTTTTQEGDNEPALPSLPIAHTQPQQLQRDDNEDDNTPIIAIAAPVPDTGTWVQRQGGITRLSQHDLYMEGVLQGLARQLSTFMARYDEDRTRMDNFITNTDTNFTNLRREQAETKESVAALNNNLGDHINTLQMDTSGRLTTLDARLTKMEEHGLTTNHTLSMLETKIAQNNREIISIREHLVDVDQNLADVDKSLTSVHIRK
jgi:hypothetical protein